MLSKYRLEPKLGDLLARYMRQRISNFGPQPMLESRLNCSCPKLEFDHAIHWVKTVILDEGPFHVIQELVGAQTWRSFGPGSEPEDLQVLVPTNAGIKT
jgi:hypothetical protein